ncbi:hypothetical protein R3W88_000540 [Solanum pinnatisectum]|uniref:Retrotransposon gag domain-containing protein n=1 Tax=Solanum pinnatisectum TaxID=50273 RepID=A0AAV9MHC4_9SOLN|nr:hypothetical protein R3W88_000540 [Solanum pinnatisectum]
MVESTTSDENAAVTRTADTIEGIEKNHNHTIYLHLSDTPGSILTSSKLGFILGTCRKSDYKPKLEGQWEKCSTFMLAWIMNTVSKELLKICTLHQGNSTVSGYFTKLRLLWDEFDALVPLHACNCDKFRIYVDHLQFLCLFTFLMGLDEVYNHARSQILMMNHLPSVSKAYAMIISDESQRMIAGSRLSKDAHESLVIYAGRGNQFMGKPLDSVMYPGNGRGAFSSMGDNSQVTDSMMYPGNGRGTYHDC